MILYASLDKFCKLNLIACQHLKLVKLIDRALIGIDRIQLLGSTQQISHLQTEIV